MKKILNTPYFGKWTKSCFLAQTLASELLKRNEEDRKVPSVRETARIYQVSCSTAANALKLLAEKGFLQQIPGKGTFLVEKKHRAMKVGIVYDPDIFTREDHFRCIQRKVCDYLLANAQQYNMEFVLVNEFAALEEKQDLLKDCSIVVSDTKGGKLLAEQPYDMDNLLPKIFYGICGDKHNPYHGLFIHSNQKKGVEEFFRRHTPCQYNKIVFVYAVYSGSLYMAENLKNVLAKFHYPEKNIEEVHLPTSNFTAKDVAERYMKKKKSSYAGQKVLLISFSDYFREGLFQAFAPEERPDILQFEGECPAPKNLSIKGNGFFGCLNSCYDRIAQAVLSALRNFAENGFFANGKLYTDMDYKEFNRKDV